MTKKQVKDYFTSAKTAPYDTAPEGESLSWIPQVSPEAALERKALVFGLDPRPPEPPKVVAQAGREPAATPVEYTAPMNADQRVLEQLSALNGGMTPAIDPTVRVPIRLLMDYTLVRFHKDTFHLDHHQLVVLRELLYHHLIQHL